MRLILLLFLALGLNAQEIRFQLLCTADTQGAVLPENPYTLKPSNRGWARLAAQIKVACPPGLPTLKVDAGGALQGDPMAAIRHKTRPDLPDASTAAMNHLQFHGMALGERDLDFGVSTLRNVEDQAQFPILAANLLLAATRAPAFTPYAIQEIQGVRIALVGLFVGQVDDADWVVSSPAEALRQLLPHLRNEEKADFVIALASTPRTPSSRDIAHQLLRSSLPVDLWCFGSQPVLNGTSLPTEPPPAGFGKALVTLRKRTDSLVSADVSISHQPLDASLAPDEDVLKATAFTRFETNRYLDTQATELKMDLDGRWVRMEDTPLSQLLHLAAAQATRAQLTALPLPDHLFYVPAGPTSVRQFWALAPDEAPLAVVQISGAQLKSLLEHNTRGFNSSHDSSLFNPEIPRSSLNLILGCGYRINLHKLLGQRITDLTLNGRPLDPETKLTLAIPLDRLTAKESPLRAIGWSDSPLSIQPDCFRNDLLRFVLANPSLDLPAPHEWRTVPALDRIRVDAQQR